MNATQAPLASPRLRRLAGRAPSAPAPERCDMCGASIAPEHRHLLDLETRQLLCTCRPCAILFERPAAGAGRLRLVEDRRLRLEHFELTDLAWERLELPVDMAFFFRSSRLEKTIAFYPSPMGATESRLELSDWQQIERANPVLASMKADVEALLVHRARGARRYWLVPIDEPYRLVALIRTRWRGFTGGKEVWTEIDRFFDDLDRRSESFDRTAAQAGPERSQ
jgi:Family of unknown function (DUF5947)